MATITQAFQVIKRSDFLPPTIKNQSAYDIPLPIGFDQTNSQPTTVAMMLEWLAPQEGNRILDVGSGSGWTSALLAYLVGPKGHIFAVERIPELLTFGAENCQRLKIKNITFSLAKSTIGCVDKSPYDRILVNASAGELPGALLDQLKIGGKLVIPIQHDIWEIARLTKTKNETVRHHGFIFVPLI